LQRFSFRTTYLPHKAGDVVMRNNGQERHIRVFAGRPIEFENGAEGELINEADEELRFTVTEFK
jgi:hypothetical protein